jgi:hypothetical protein
MAKGPKSQRAAEVVDDDKEVDHGKNRAAVELGRRGGKARAEKMTPEQRAEIARKAARERWKS